MLTLALNDLVKRLKLKARIIHTNATNVSKSPDKKSSLKSQQAIENPKNLYN